MTHSGALGKLVDSLAELGDYGGALDYARRYIACDSLSEEAHCALIRLHLAAGHYTDALRQYKELERVLREEMGTAPSPAARQLLADTHAAPPQKTAVQPAAAIIHKTWNRRGAVPLNSPFYIVRPGDEQFRGAISRQDSIVLVKARGRSARPLCWPGACSRPANRVRKLVSDGSAKAIAGSIGIRGSLVPHICRNDRRPVGPRCIPGSTVESPARLETSTSSASCAAKCSEVLNSIGGGLDEVDRLFGCTFSGVVFGLSAPGTTSAL